MLKMFIAAQDTSLSSCLHYEFKIKLFPQVAISLITDWELIERTNKSIWIFLV